MYVPCSALIGLRISTLDTTEDLALDAPIIDDVHKRCGPTGRFGAP